MEIQRIRRDYSSDTMVKNPPANAGNTVDAGLILGLGRSPGEGKGDSLQYSFLGSGQRSPVGYNPWVIKSWTQ